ncbi:hypothetical protein LINGRAHAP2_LOCUS16968 [Linum grandiflorum]
MSSETDGEDDLRSLSNSAIGHPVANSIASDASCTLTVFCTACRDMQSSSRKSEAIVSGSGSGSGSGISKSQFNFFSPTELENSGSFIIPIGIHFC